MKKIVFWILAFVILLLLIGPVVFSEIAKVDTVRESPIGNFRIVNDSKWTPIISTSSWAGQKLLGKFGKDATIFWNADIWWIGNRQIVLILSYPNYTSKKKFSTTSYSWGDVAFTQKTVNDSTKSIAFIFPYVLVVGATNESIVKDFLSNIKSIETIN